MPKEVITLAHGKMLAAAEITCPSQTLSISSWEKRGKVAQGSINVQRLTESAIQQKGVSSNTGCIMSHAGVVIGEY